MNTGAGLYQHLFDIPKMFAAPAAMTLASNNEVEQAQYFWIPLHILVLVTLILSAIFNWSNPNRRKFVLTALGIYLYISVVSIYFAHRLTVFAAMSDTAEFHSQTKQWLALLWHRPILQVICEVILLIGISKPKIDTPAYI